VRSASTAVSFIFSKHLVKSPLISNANIYDRAQWDEHIVQTLYRRNFEYFADVAHWWVIMPTNLTASCRCLSNTAILRTSVTFHDMKSLAYAKSQYADDVIWPTYTPNAPGDHDILHVEATPCTDPRKQKRKFRELRTKGRTTTPTRSGLEWSEWDETKEVRVELRPEKVGFDE
jgi:hypothetical protein